MKHVHSTQTYRCDCCDFEFKSLDSLRGHQHYMKNKDDTRNHMCEHCGAAFTTKSCLKKHIQEWVSSLYRIQNILCQKLETRFQNVHLENQFHCDICEKSFSQKAELKRHMKLRLIEAKFKFLIQSLGFKVQRHFNNLSKEAR